MHIFLSYASEQKEVAEPIAFSLRGHGFDVFLDRDDLPAARNYDEQIREAVFASDLFIFLISPQSVAKGRYTLTELEFARQRWRSPNRRVFPVMIRTTEMATIPAFLKGVTILEPGGNIAAEVVAQVQKHYGRPTLSQCVPLLIALGILSGLASSLIPNALPEITIGGVFSWQRDDLQRLIINQAAGSDIGLASGAATGLQNGLWFGAVIAYAVWRWEGRTMVWPVIAALVTTLAWIAALNTAYQIAGAHVADAAISGVFGGTSDIVTVKNTLSTAMLLLAGGCAGAVGAFGVWLAAALAQPTLRRPDTIALMVLTGAAFGLLLKIAIDADSGLGLYVPWQAALAAGLGYGLTRAPS